MIPRFNTLVAATLLPLAALGLLSTLVILFFISLPDVDQLKGCFTTSMYRVEVCPGRGTYTPLSQIAPELVEAVVASEDAAFFSHTGFDWHEIQESLSTNLASGGYKRGGSTISQQLAKNAFLSHEKSILRKVREAVLTVSLESKFSKKQILEKYLNMVEFGPDIYGVGAASRHYFGRTPSELNLLQSAFLAFLLPNPKEYHKSFSRGQPTAFGKKSLTVILRRLQRFNKISPSTYEQAVADLDGFPWSALVQGGLSEPNENFTAPTADQIQTILREESFDDETETVAAPEPEQEPEPQQDSDPGLDATPVESESSTNSTWD